MKIIIGADHRGFALKEDLKMFLEAEGHDVHDVGATEYDSTDDYPDFALTVGELVAVSPDARGILLCGSATGVMIAANKVPGVRAVAAYDEDLAREAREHEDVNVLALSADRTDQDMARLITATFLTTPFSAEERHMRRLKKIAQFELGE